MSVHFAFDDATIQRIFGHEAAENENAERLREYYFKTQVFERITADLPLRILVGHKGIGKSALFTVAMQEDREQGILPILIRPDDVIEVSAGDDEFLQRIRDWKKGLLKIIFNKSLVTLDVKDYPTYDNAVKNVGRVANFVSDLLRPTIEKHANVDIAQGAIAHQLLKSAKINVYLDDLDRGWKGDRSGIDRLSTLLNALRDLGTERLSEKHGYAARSYLNGT